jgi:hypothetical protein
MADSIPDISWVPVERFDRPVDEYFAALDAWVQASGTTVRRFTAQPAEQAIYLAEPPLERHGNWRLDPAPQTGAVLAVSQNTTDEAIERLRATISVSEALHYARVVGRTRVPEGRGHLQGRAHWFSRRHTGS